MKKGKSARKPTSRKEDAEEKPDDKPQKSDSSLARINRFWLERLERLKQERLQRRGLFRFEMVMTSSSLVFCAVIVVFDFPPPLRLGAAAAMWYIFKELIKDMTNKF